MSSLRNLVRAAAGAAAAAVLLVSAPANAATGESSFTPTSVRSPILRVELYSSQSEPRGGGDMDAGGSEGGVMDGGAGAAPTRPQSLYTCATLQAYEDQRYRGVAPEGGAALTPADVQRDCTVDLADNAALQALFAGDHEIEVATYDSIRVHTCVEQQYDIQIKGTVTLSGDEYRTTSGPDPLTPGAGDAEYATVTHQGCAFSFSLPIPVTIRASDDVTVNAFFSIRNIAWGQLNSHNQGMGGCLISGTNGHGLCTSYTNIVPYVGTVAPALETYHVTVDPADLTVLEHPLDVHASGQVLLIVDSTGNMLGGFTRRLLSEQSTHEMGFDTPLKSIVASSGSPVTYSLENYGSTADGPGYLRMAHFRRETHSDTMDFPQDGSPSISYGAVRQP